LVAEEKARVAAIIRQQEAAKAKPPAKPAQARKPMSSAEIYAARNKAVASTTSTAPAARPSPSRRPRYGSPEDTAPGTLIQTGKRGGR
jgi:hypothetical protein